MGVPTSEVSYTSATTGRETTKSMTDMWWHWIKKKILSCPWARQLLWTHCHIHSLHSQGNHRVCPAVVNLLYPTKVTQWWPPPSKQALHLLKILFQYVTQAHFTWMRINCTTQLRQYQQQNRHYHQLHISSYTSISSNTDTISCYTYPATPVSATDTISCYTYPATPVSATDTISCYTYPTTPVSATDTISCYTYPATPVSATDIISCYV
jgi:hypothetical protein